MRMSGIKIYFFLLAIFFYGCVTDSKDNIHLMNAESIKDINIVGRRIDFTIGCWVPSPCYESWGSDYFNLGNIFTSKLYGRQTSDLCVASIGHIDGNVSITVDSAGAYKFKFLDAFGTSIDTILMIK